MSSASRWSRRSLLALTCLAAAAAGCSGIGSEGRTSDKVTDVGQTAVKDQSIGNCWIYATASWAESLHRGFAHEDVDLSESYWTYWNWYDAITEGQAESGVETGGNWEVAADLIERRGYAFEGDFIPEEANAILSTRQATALAAINASIKGGALSTSAARADRSIVRSELDKAWQLSASVKAALDAVFGPDGSATLRDGAVAPAGSIVHPASALSTGVDPTASASDAGPALDAGTKASDGGGASADGGSPASGHVLTLADDVGHASSWGYGRDGTYAWGSVSYPSTPIDRRHVQERVQHAMHDKKPVIINWFVDFNAMDAQGRFAAPPAKPGRQGGHLTVLEDYQITNVPGFGTLAAGTVETRPDALQAALSDQATLEFFRIKNSWGDYKSVPGTIGWHDLYMQYLDGPVQQCATDANDVPDPTKCHDVTPLRSFVLPPGY